MKPGLRNLITDVPGLLVGHAQDADLRSGSTVLLGEGPFVASVHVMGGAPGTRETDLLAPDKSVAMVDALVLSGGSAYGLDACSGVMDALRADGRGLRLGAALIPLVPGAILFDLLNGGAKDWAENPYRALGAAAYADARADFEIGSVGAGTGAMTAMLKGGLGSASLVLPSGATVGALVAVNPVGSVTTPGERHFWAAPFEMNGEFGGLGPDSASGLVGPYASRRMQLMSQRGNTTIAIVASDAILTKAQCQRMATAAHDGIARAIVPANTPHDGDLVFGLSTSGRSIPEAEVLDIGVAAGHCLARAIARAIFAARPAPGDLLPCWSGG
jgi:L-aminopeptidase/D-esterase-like protein